MEGARRGCETFSLKFGRKNEKKENGIFTWKFKNQKNSKIKNPKAARTLHPSRSLVPSFPCPFPWSLVPSLPSLLFPSFVRSVDRLFPPSVSPSFRRSAVPLFGRRSVVPSARRFAVPPFLRPSFLRSAVDVPSLRRSVVPSFRGCIAPSFLPSRVPSLVFSLHLEGCCFGVVLRPHTRCSLNDLVVACVITRVLA